MKKKKLILELMIVFILITVILAITIYSIKEDKKNENVSSEPHIKTAEEKNQEEIEELKGKGEKSRMQFYVSKYFSYIEARRLPKCI